MGGFSLFLDLLEDLALARIGVKLLEFELALYFLLVLPGEQDVS